MSYILIVPQPCSENWNRMKTTWKGAFCQKCDKEVLNFSDLSKEALSKKLEGGKSICGRFHQSQLNRPIPAPSQNIWKRKAVMLGFTSVFAISGNVIAQQEKTAMVQILQNKMPICGLANAAIPTDSIRIQGNIREVEGPLPGAYVVLKGTSIGAQSDFDGNFTIKIPKANSDLGDTLVFSTIGYENLEIPITSKTEFVTATFTDAEVIIMGEMVVVHKMNIFRRIGNWLRGR